MTKPAKTHEYLEVEILGRTCYVTQETLRIFYGLAGHITGSRKRFNELPEDAFIVNAIWTRKKALVIAREKQLAAVARGGR